MKYRLHFRSFLWLLGVVLLVAACSNEVGIHGTVTDAKGNPVADAEVRLSKSGDPKNAIVTVKTGADGKYKLANPEPGQYLLSILWLDPDQCTDTGSPLSRNGNFLVALTRAGNSRSALTGVSDQVNVTANSGQTFDLKFEACQLFQKTPRTQQQNDFLATLQGKIVFYRGNPSSIYIMNPNGSDLRQLTSTGVIGVSPDCSPDGKRLVFRDIAEEIYTINPDGSNRVKLITKPQNGGLVGNYSPHWSPDGAMIAYAQGRPGQMELFVMNADGSQQTQLTKTGKDNIRPAWSPDGNQIAYFAQADHKYFTMNRDGSNVSEATEKNLTDFEKEWSPDKKAYVTSKTGNGHFDIFVVSADDSISVSLTDDKQFDGSPTWCQ